MSDPAPTVVGATTGRSRWLGIGLILLGAAVTTAALLGPFVLDVLRYRTSPTTLNQVVGVDAAALVVVAPASVIVGVLALRGHPAAPVLALAPSVFAVYTYTQLIVGNEYLRLPGNVERFFPLLLGIFILAGATAVCAWGGASAAALPALVALILVALILAALSAYLYRPLLLRATLPTPAPALIAGALR